MFSKGDPKFSLRWVVNNIILLFLPASKILFI